MKCTLRHKRGCKHHERPRIDFESAKSYDGIIIDISKAKSKTVYDVFIDYDFVYPKFIQFVKILKLSQMCTM